MDFYQYTTYIVIKDNSIMQILKVFLSKMNYKINLMKNKPIKHLLILIPYLNNQIANNKMNFLLLLFNFNFKMIKNKQELFIIYQLKD